MYRIIEGSIGDLPDVLEFLETLNALDQHPVSEARGLFDPGAELFVARAPGRLDVMGGIADYSGSLVLQLPLAEATLVALQRVPSRSLRIVTLSGPASFELPLSLFESEGRPLNYDRGRALFDAPERRWAAYAAGTFLVLMRERGARFPEGARLLIASRVPQGKGVSSSASLEVAVMQAVAAAFQIAIPPRDMALLCQKVENLVAGAPCGVMDQMTAVSGEAGKLLALLCRPAELEGSVAIPGEIAFWGLDSGVSHCVSGADYGSVRVGTFMGRRILSSLGAPVEHLAALPPSEFEQHYAARLPDRVSGAGYL
jgi:L-arabinokinase